MAVLQKEHNQLLSKVPQVTIFFWLIKVLCRLPLQRMKA